MRRSEIPLLALGIAWGITVGPAMADVYRFAAAEDSDWMNGRNWQNQTVGTNGWQVPGGIALPDSADTVRFNYASNHGTLAADAGTIDALQIGVDEGGSFTLNAGASLTTDTGGWSGMGAGGSSSGTLTIDGGLLTINNSWRMGVNDNAHTVGLVVNGGEMRVASGGFSQAKVTTTALTTINGGVLHVNALTLSSGVIDIAGGTLKIDGDYRPDVTGWVGSGLMVANGGIPGVSIDATFSNGVTTVVAAPDPQAAVPDVVGLPQATAAASIVSTGLVVGIVTTVPDEPGDGFDVDDVLSQDPLGGTSVPLGSAVDLVVVGPPILLATVPDVTGLAQAVAEATVVSSGLVVGAVTTLPDVPDDGFAVGDVFSQNPAGGVTVVTGSLVDLVVVVPQPSLDVPSFDVDSDGFDDLIHIARDGDLLSAEVLYSDGVSFNQSPVSGSASNHPSEDRWFTGDFNGDGAMDLARLWGGTDGDVNCEVETTLQDGSLDLVAWANASGFSASQRWFKGDFDGDGSDDLLEMPYGGTTLLLKVYRSTGTTFVPSTWLWSAGSRSEGDWFFVTDCTGDGAEDVVHVYASGGDVVCKVYSVNGAGSAFVQSDWSPPAYAYVPDHRWYPGDYNGDGNGDFAVLRSEAGDAHVDVLLSTGSGFSVQANWVNGGTPYTYGETMWYPGDFNGDGNSDLVNISDDAGLLSAAVWVSTGSGFAGSVWSSGQGDYQDEADLFLSDVDGDNKQDIVCVKRTDYQSVIDLYVSSGTGFSYLPGAYSQLARFDSLRGGPAIRRHKYFDPHTILGPMAADGGDYDDVCRSGQDVYLAQGAEYIHTDTASSWLRAMAPQQVIETFEAKTLDEFAQIVRYSMTSHNLLELAGQSSVLAQKIVGDGRRYHVSAADITSGFAKGGAHFFGGRNASHHRFNRIFVFDSVGQTAFKIQEADAANRNVHRGNRIENCFVFGAGVDPRGNGRNPDLLSSWADAIGLSSRETVIRNNLVIDGTDVGIVLFTAPDSVVEDNVVASVSRSCLGGINLLDTLFYNEWGINGPDAQGRLQYDFSSLVQSNYIDARGARMDVGIPVGWRTWTPPSDPSIDNPYGIHIVNNTLDGEAFGYGIAVANAFNITATGNVSHATHSGVGGYYMLPHLMPDPASAFAYAPLHTFNCTYGAEFSPASEQNGLDFIIFNTKHSATFTPDGYIYTPYQPAEAVATVESAYLEMLHRYPTPAELTFYTNSLISAYGRSDELRLELMQSPEFDVANPTFSGDKTINGMQLYRHALWLENLMMIDAVSYNTDGNHPASKRLYQDALAYLTEEYLPAGVVRILPASDGFELEYEGALMTSTDLLQQSWHVVDPQPGSPVTLTPDVPHGFFKAAAE